MLLLISSILLSTFLSHFGLVMAQNATEIDDTDPSIVYTGNWEASSGHLDSHDFGGSHTLSEDPNAAATFTFTGVRVQYLAPKWPYFVDTLVSLDGQSGVSVNMQTEGENIDGREVAMWDALWDSGDLENTQHTVVVSIGSSGYAVMDGFRYFTQQATSTTSSSSTADSSTSSSDSSSSSSSSSVPPSQQSSTTDITTNSNRSVTVGIAIGSTAAAMILLAIIILLLLHRRRAKKIEDAHSDMRPSSTYMIPHSGGPSSPNGLPYSHQPSGSQGMRQAYNLAGHPYSSYSTTTQGDNSMKYSDLTGGSTGNGITAPDVTPYGAQYGQYGFYPIGVRPTPRPDQQMAGEGRERGGSFGPATTSGSPNSQTTFIDPRNNGGGLSYAPPHPAEERSASPSGMSVLPPYAAYQGQGQGRGQYPQFAPTPASSGHGGGMSMDGRGRKLPWDESSLSGSLK